MKPRLFALPLTLLCASCGTPPPLDTPQVTTALPAQPPPETGAVCGSAPLAPKSGSIARVVVRGAPGSLDACALIQSKPGLPLDEALVDQDLTHLFATGHLADVVVTVESGADAADTLVYQVTPRPLIATLALDGGLPTKPEALAELVHLQPGAPLSRQATLDAEAHIEAACFDEGYRRATATTELRPAGEGHVDVIFKVALGPATRVGSVTVEGNKAFPQPELRKLLDPLQGEPLREWQLVQVRNQLMDRYRDTGRVLADVAEPRLTESADATRADVLFRVTEGPLFKVGKITFAGLPCPAPADRNKLLGETRPGAVASPAVLRATIARLQAACAPAGKPANVVPSVTLDEKKKTLDITFEIAAPP